MIREMFAIWKTIKQFRRTAEKYLQYLENAEI